MKDKILAPEKASVAVALNVPMDPALQMNDGGSFSILANIRRGLLAADAAGAIHKHFLILEGCSVALHPQRELVKGFGARIERSLEVTDLVLHAVSTVDENGVTRVGFGEALHRRVPFLRGQVPLTGVRHRDGG